MKATSIAALCIAVSQLFFAPNSASGQDLKEVIEQTLEEQNFWGTVLVYRNGSTQVWNRGQKSKTDKEMVSENTHYGVASITKMFTAICILQMQEEGLFSLEQTVSELLPQLDIPNSKKIRVHDLLLHISGLPNEDDVIYTKGRTGSEFIDYVIENGKSTTPGNFNYANIDYVILSLIIEKYSQKSWKEEIKSRILEPSGMKETGVLELGNYPTNFAYSGSIDADGNYVPDPLFHIENFGAAGAMYSTAEDLLKLHLALSEGKLVNEESQRMMYKSYPEYNYSGYSVWTYPYPYSSTTPLIMERRGSILGAQSVIVRFLDTKDCIVILNHNGQFNPDSFGDPENLKEKIIQLMYP